MRLSKETITKLELDQLIRDLKTYKYYHDSIERLTNDLEEIKSKLEQCREVKGIDYTIPTSTKGGNGSYHTRLAHEEATLEHKIQKAKNRVMDVEDINQRLMKLEDFHQKILIDRFYNGISQEKIAMMMGYESKDTIRHYEKQALKKMLEFSL